MDSFVSLFVLRNAKLCLTTTITRSYIIIAVMFSESSSTSTVLDWKIKSLLPMTLQCTFQSSIIRRR